ILILLLTQTIFCQNRVVRIGVYENSPKVFTSKSGEPAGIFIDIIQEIAMKENWQIEFIHGTWGEGLDRLKNGEIDIMPDVAYSNERKLIYEFHDEPVLSDWFQVYVNKNSHIKSIVDLADKIVIVLEKSIQQSAFVSLTNQFNFKCTLVSLPDYNSMFEHVYKGLADAVIANRFYGIMHAQEFDLEDTGIIFNPTQLFFAFPKQIDTNVEKAIDDHLIEFKKDQNSVYYKTLEKWTSKKVEFDLPVWIRIIGIIAVTALIMSLFGVIILKKQVRKRTEELETANSNMEMKIKERTFELEKANKRLEEASRLKSKFLANMSHELRTPLNSIIGFTGIILQGITGEINEEQKKQLTMVFDSAKHLLGLINDILDISKIEAGKIELIKADFDIYELINNVEKMITPLTLEKSIELNFTISNNLPKTIYNDKNRIKQVLINLLSNALKFTDKGVITLKIENIEVDNGMNLLQFQVTDSGIGISKDNLESIFEEFSQIENSNREKPVGTGLGLAISKKMVELMGGKIWVESEFGKGSTFFFTVTGSQDQVDDQKTKEIKNNMDMNKRLILTIDDDLLAQQIIKTYLKSEGYEVIQAYNAKEAMELAKKHRPFAITLDIVMPGKDGWDILREIKQDQEICNIPVICISMMDNRDMGLSLGAVEYLIKPIDKQQFINELIKLEGKTSTYDILIVDDEPKASEVISNFIDEKEGYLRIDNVDEKNIFAENLIPDLLIIDLHKLRLSKIQTTGKSKVLEIKHHISIVIITNKQLTVKEKNYLNKIIGIITSKFSLSNKQLLEDIKKIL
ncbi:MAG: response regulator, partial [Candidatus Delongbacteria bacterium]|nr:response regulator [Candidatus Delongbacteria bacterium]